MKAGVIALLILQLLGRVTTFSTLSEQYALGERAVIFSNHPETRDEPEN